jgi:hypothetical protein
MIVSQEEFSTNFWIFVKKKVATFDSLKLRLSIVVATFTY